MTCKEHPRYKAKKAPQVTCETCWRIYIQKMKPVTRKTPYKVAVPKTETVRVGVCSDTHFNSKYQQLTHLQDFYARCIDAGCQAVLNCGDITDGPPSMHKGYFHEKFLFTYEDTVDWTVENYPSGIDTYVIAGNHDSSFMKADAGNVTRAICQERPDLTYCGDYQSIVQVGKLKLMLAHTAGANPYALSYRLQKMVEGLASENKPHVLLHGHFHSSVYCFIRNVHCFQVGCFQSQTPYMTAKSLYPAIGGWILEIEQTQLGMGAIDLTFVSYPKAVHKDF